jgi:hypothetical protein
MQSQPARRSEGSRGAVRRRSGRRVWHTHTRETSSHSRRLGAAVLVSVYISGCVWSHEAIHQPAVAAARVRRRRRRRHGPAARHTAAAPQPMLQHAGDGAASYPYCRRRPHHSSRYLSLRSPPSSKPTPYPEASWSTYSTASLISRSVSEVGVYRTARLDGARGRRIQAASASRLRVGAANASRGVDARTSPASTHPEASRSAYLGEADAAVGDLAERSILVSVYCQ